MDITKVTDMQGMFCEARVFSDIHMHEIHLM